MYLLHVACAMFSMTESYHAPDVFRDLTMESSRMDTS